jgi:DNA-binding LacI/PurR family transcriptional regulator
MEQSASFKRRTLLRIDVACVIRHFVAMDPNQPERPVTMRDVAEKAGVNPSTVSRALREDSNVSKKRREEIQRIAEEMGYRPNPFVQAFTAHVRGYRRLPTHAPIALLDTLPERQHQFTDRYVEGAKAHAHRMGYKIEPLHIETVKGSLTRLKDVLFARGIRGLLVVPPSERIHMPELADYPVAMATFDYSLKEPNLHRATPSYFQNMEMALRTSAAKGYRRIGFCTHPQEVDRIGMHWLGAYCGWRDLQPPENQLEVHYNSYYPELEKQDDPQAWQACRQDFYAWMEQHRPDLVIANNLFFLDWVREKGFDVPDDLGFVHLGLNPSAPGVSGVDQNHHQVGAAAVDLVINQLQKNTLGVPETMQTVLIYGSWVNGGTTR